MENNVNGGRVLTEVQAVQMIFGLSEALAKLFLLLVKTKLVTPHMVETELKIVSQTKMAVLRVRRRLASGGHDVEIQASPGLGYWLSDDTRQDLFARIRRGQGDVSLDGGDAEAV